MNQSNIRILSLCDCDTCDSCDSSGQVSQLSQLLLSQTPGNPKIGVDMKLLKKGDRIRLKVRTIGGWKGTGTVTEDQAYGSDTIWFRKDGGRADNCAAGRHEVALIRTRGEP